MIVILEMRIMKIEIEIKKLDYETILAPLFTTTTRRPDHVAARAILKVMMKAKSSRIIKCNAAWYQKLMLI